MEIKNKPIKENDLSCTFCGPGTWAVWEVVTEEGVFFVCDPHHVELSEAKVIKRERRMRQENWTNVFDVRERSWRNKKRNHQNHE